MKIEFLKVIHLIEENISVKVSLESDFIIPRIDNAISYNYLSETYLYESDKLDGSLWYYE